MTLSFTVIIKGHFISSTHFIKSFVSQRFSRHARVRGHENRTEVQDLSCRSFSRLTRTHSYAESTLSTLRSRLPSALLPFCPSLPSYESSIHHWPRCRSAFWILRSSDGFYNLTYAASYFVWIAFLQGNDRSLQVLHNCGDQTGDTYGTPKSQSLRLSNVAEFLFQSRPRSYQCQRNPSGSITLVFLTVKTEQSSIDDRI